MNLHFNITQDWKSRIRPKIVGHYAIPFCKHKYEDPNIVCPVDLANDERLKSVANISGIAHWNTKTKTMNKIDAIVIHCSATRAGQDVRAADMGVLWQDGGEERPADAREKPERRGAA